MTDTEKKRILFIEDEENMQKIITSSLQEEGFEVFSAYDGESGIKMLEEKRVDLVLLDLILPKKDGFDVLEFMRSREETKHTPVIILTNLEEKFDIQRAANFDVRAYMVKAQYKITEIIDKIQEVLKTK